MQASAETHGATTVKGDPLSTPVGLLLRRCRIDELPQLLNVLNVDISIICARLERTALSEECVRHLPVYVYRHLVRPSMTGRSQVHGG